MKPFFILLLCLIGSSAVAAEHQHDKGDEQDHSIGVHGMALMMAGDDLIVSHMPLHGGKHAHQILLSVSVSPDVRAQLSNLLNGSELVSIAPEPFSLNQLQSGDLDHFKADIYLGHFERNGSKVIQGVEFQVKQRLLMKHLAPAENGSYFTVPLAASQWLLVHRIGKLPSFDQIVLVSTGKPLPPFLELGTQDPLTPKRFSALYGNEAEWLKLLYLEQQDFLQIK